MIAPGKDFRDLEIGEPNADELRFRSARRLGA
jgi:hypothetical protein